jgi:hypothetical protein
VQVCKADQRPNDTRNTTQIKTKTKSAPDTDRILAARHDFCTDNRRLDNRRLDPGAVISVDETCLYFNTQNGYAKRGRRLRVPLHQRRHDNYMLLLAVGYQVLQGSANSQVMPAWSANCTRTPEPHTC